MSFRLNHMDNGTYLCHSKNEYGSDTTVVHTVVQDKPQVKIEYVRGVDMDKIFFNWTLTDWNAPVTDYRLSVSYYLISLPNAATFHKLFFAVPQDRRQRLGILLRREDTSRRRELRDA